MGSIRCGCGHFDVRLVLCRRPWIHSLDDYRRAFQPRSETRGHVDRCTGQLDGKFPCRAHFSASTGNKQRILFSQTWTLHLLLGYFRKRCKITSFCRSAFCWPFSGSLPTKSYRKQRTRLSTRYRPCSDETIGRNSSVYFLVSSKNLKSKSMIARNKVFFSL